MVSMYSYIGREKERNDEKNGWQQPALVKHTFIFKSQIASPLVSNALRDVLKIRYGILF